MDFRLREVFKVVEPVTVREGAGVRLKRTIASRELDYLDPFLLLDHFGSDDPADYLAGFPMHPHRGIETVTYMLAGAVSHRDSLGNAGSIGAGDVQWMTAGGGIMHEEMPQPVDGKMAGFQLWVNLPAQYKMTAPKYQEFASEEIPELHRSDGIQIRVIAGTVDDITGPVSEIVADPIYLDVTIPPQGMFNHMIQRGHTAFAYLFDGVAAFGPTDPKGGATVGHPKLVVFADGDFVQIRTGEESARFLLVSGKPLYEPIVRYGPFVMNTPEEIQQALQDLRDGTFAME